MWSVAWVKRLPCRDRKEATQQLSTWWAILWAIQKLLDVRTSLSRFSKIQHRVGPWRLWEA